MKKCLILLLISVICFSFFCCGTEGNNTTHKKGAWSVIQTVDEFGDVTNDSVDVISGVFTGSFIKTGEAESDLSVEVTFRKKAEFNHYVVEFTLKEYNDILAIYTDEDSKELKYKIGESEDVVTERLVGEEPNKALCLGTDDYSYNGDYIFNALLNGENVKCIITIGESEYKFTIDSDNLVLLASENNISMAAGDFTVKEAIDVYLNDTIYEHKVFGDDFLSDARSCLYGLCLDRDSDLDADSINNLLNGYFLEITCDNYDYIEIKHKYSDEEYRFPYWRVSKYDMSNGKLEIKAFLNIYKYQAEYYLKYTKNIIEHGYEKFRSFETSNITADISLDMDRLDFSYGSGVIEEDCYCKRITDEIFVIYKEEFDDDCEFPSGVTLYRIMIAIDESDDLSEIVESARKAFSKIKN